MWNEKNFRPHKALKDFYTIGELKDLYGYGVDSLRYFEKKGLLHPLRGENRYRHYSNFEFWTLNIIRSLRNIGLSVGQIGDYLGSRSVTSTKQILEQSLDVIERQITLMEKSSENICKQIRTIDFVEGALSDMVTVLRLPERPIVLLDESYYNNNDYASMKYQLLKENANGQYFSMIADNRVGSATALSRAQEGDYTTYDCMFLLDENGKDTIPAGTYLSIMYRGESPQNKKYIKRLIDYAQRNDLKIKGPFLELIWLDLHATKNPKEWATEVQAEIEV